MADPNAFEVESDAPEPARPDLLLAPGDRLGQWEILGLLGRGAQGIVYEARDAEGGRLAALKVLREAPEPSAGAETSPGLAGAETLRREAAILAALDHPNLVSARGLESIDGRAVLVLEPIDGLCLADRLSQAERPITEDELFVLLLGLAEALKAVHQAGYLHRDIKPGNVYLRDDASPILIDFSAAGRPGEESEAEHSQSLVTSRYAPIEQYQMDGKEGPWTDLYGLAALAYRIVTGRPPPPAPARLAGEALPSARDLAKGRYSAVLLAAVDRGLALDPAGRPAAMTDWINLLQWANRQRQGQPSPPAEPAASVDTAAPPEPEEPDRVPPPIEPVVAARPAPPRIVEPAPKPVEAPAAPPKSEASEPDEAPRRAPPSAPASSAPQLPTAPLDDLPPTEKVTRMPLSLQAEDAPADVQLRAERRELRPQRRSGALGFVLTASLLAVLGWGGWEGYLSFVKSDWSVDPAGGGDAVSIAQAMARARDGATLHLAAGTYKESVTLARPLILAGPEDDRTPAIIEPAVGPCVLAQADGASLRNLVLRRPAPVSGTGAGPAPAGGPCLDIAASTRIEDSEVSNAAGPAVTIRDGADPALTRVTVSAAAGAGLVIEGGARGSFTEGAIRETAKAGVLVRSGARPTVSNSLIEKTGQAGILVTGGGQGLFQGNEIREAGASAVEIRGGADPELRDNRITAAKEAGLYVHDGGAGRMTNNEIAGNAYSGVVIGPGGTPALTENQVTGNGEHGLAILAGGGGRIERNRIVDNGGHGIARSSEASAMVGANELSGNREPQSQTGRLEGE